VNDHIHPVMAAALAQALEEERRIRADLRMQAMKDSGELQRRETDRAHREELKWAVPA